MDNSRQDVGAGVYSTTTLDGHGRGPAAERATAGVPIRPADETSVPRPADPFSLAPADLDGGLDVAFDADGWVESTNPSPRTGWRRLLWRASGGRYRPDPDEAEQRARVLLARTRRPFTGARTVAVVSTKGGVGKTTTALNLGHTLAAIRGDRIVALDANPDAGSLGHRVRRETEATASDLLAHSGALDSYAQIRPFTSQAPSRLEVIASADDPTTTRRLSREDYWRLLDVLRRQYNLVLADCGTGILDPATRGVVQAADQLVIVTGPSVDAVRAVTYLLAWLNEHGMADKVAGAVVVVNGVRSSGGPVDIGRIEAHFAEMVRDIVTIPWDDELSNGATVELDWLAGPTRQAYLRLAASVIENLITTADERHDGSRGELSTAAMTEGDTR